MNICRSEFFLKNLSNKEKDDFLRELLEAKYSEKDINKIILSWEATAEINSSPLSRAKIIARSKKIKHLNCR